MPKVIRQSVTFAGRTPAEVYEALMDSRKHSRFTRAKANISRKVGGKFTAYDGYIEGTNLQLIPNKNIIQLWRGSDWPDGHYARTTYVLERTRTGTKLRFRQSNVPDAQYESIKRGWMEYYWKPMKEMFRKEGDK